MSQSRVSTALILAGAVVIVAGVAMYVLPGPGFPFLILGFVLAAAGIVARVNHKS